jgi:hypothetical protein
MRLAELICGPATFDCITGQFLSNTAENRVNASWPVASYIVLCAELIW